MKVRYSYIKYTLTCPLHLITVNSCFICADAIERHHPVHIIESLDYGGHLYKVEKCIIDGKL